MKCRACKKNISHIFLDLGFSPPSNEYINAADINKPELFYPLKTFICDNCWLVQTEDFVRSKDLFKNDYAYLSSTSKLWLEHSKKYVSFITKKLNLSKDSFVVELASNDGYLLHNFKKMNIPCLGVEPTIAAADISIKQGINVIVDFFSNNLALKIKEKFQKADLIIGNNVFAHVPDVNDFTKGMKSLLKKNGTITLEFPHLLKLIKGLQFDTIYHEHFSYFSLISAEYIFKKNNLKIYHVEELDTHGGSLRIFLSHINNDIKINSSVIRLLNKEKEYKLNKLATYSFFNKKVLSLKFDILNYLIRQKKSGKKIAAYGAAAKGNTLLNYLGVKSDLIDFVCDNSKLKQNKFLPGSHIPIVSDDFLYLHKPDLIIIFPWNISNEIIKSIDKKRLNSKFIKLIPKINILK